MVKRPDCWDQITSRTIQRLQNPRSLPTSIWTWLIFLWPLRDMVAMGAEHSSLNSAAERAAARLHLSLSPDPAPEQVFFIRSDQYSFVKQGIPAIYPSPGVKSGDAKTDPLKIRQNWEQTRYHQPSDDMKQPGLLFDQAARFAQFTFLVGYFVAEDPQRPTWNKGDFFGDRYGKKR